MPKILQIGLGAFGRQHLKMWNEMGLMNSIWMAELDASAYEYCKRYNMAKSRFTTNYEDFLGRVDIVDIVTPATSHYEIARECLLSGKDVFVEKPMTMTSEEASRLTRLVEDSRAILQVGYHFRYNDLTRFVKGLLKAGTLGEVRYAYGHFMGFKRPRMDVGVTHSDSVHFFDLFNYLLGKFPKKVTAFMRDHLGRGFYNESRFMFDDASLAILDYDGELAHVESGYVQPGRWIDPYVPGPRRPRRS